MLYINEIGDTVSNKERRIHKLFESGLPNREVKTGRYFIFTYVYTNRIQNV